MYENLPGKPHNRPDGLAGLKPAPEPHADVFDTLFAANPRDRKTRDRYRRVILHPRGRIDAKETVGEPLDRPVNPEELFRRLRMADL